MVGGSFGVGDDDDEPDELADPTPDGCKHERDDSQDCGVEVLLVLHKHAGQCMSADALASMQSQEEEMLLARKAAKAPTRFVRLCLSTHQAGKQFLSC